MGDAQRRSHRRRRRGVPSVALLDVGSYVKEGVWSVTVQRVREWAVWYVQHSWRASLAWVLVDPWDAWSALSPYDRRKMLMSYLRRVSQEGAESNGGEPKDPDFKDRFPALFEHLVASRYPDGSARRTCSLTVFVEDAAWKMCLNDRDQNLVLFVTEGRFDGCLEALELLLQEEQPPWRKSKQFAGKKGPGGR